MSWPLLLIVIWIVYCALVWACWSGDRAYQRWIAERPLRERVAAALRRGR
jgi:hypothetical protein